MRVGGQEKRSSGDSGFTLIEVLVVIAILGLIAVILTVAVSRAVKRQRLDTAAQQLRSFMDKAYVLTTQTGDGVFVDIGAQQPDGTRLVRLIEDSNANHTLDSTDPVLDNQTITSDLALANSATAGGAWPVVGTDMELLCDSMGRAIDPVTGTQIAQPKDITLTHKEMLNGTLRPRIRYTIEIYPLWNPKLTKETY